MLSRALKILPLFLIIPCLLWLSLDKNLWPWDPAMYGFESIKLWRILILYPADYIATFFHLMGFKAPMIGWIGQFFVPLGRWIGYEKALLLMQVFFSLLMIYKITRWKEFSSSSLYFIAGAFLVASTPLFIFQTHYFFVEVLQAFGVVLIWDLYLKRKEMQVAQLALAFLAYAFFLMGVKISSPVYVVLPSLAILQTLWIRRREFSFKVTLNKSTMAWLVFCGGLMTIVIIWYFINGYTVFEFAKNSTTGKDVILYAQKKPVFAQFYFWCFYIKNLFWGGRTKHIFEILFVLSALLNWQKLMDSPFWIAVAQIALFLLMVSFQINEETRYSYPLFVYFVYIFGRVVTLNRVLACLFIVIFTFRWAEINLATLGVWRLPIWLPWSDSIDREGKDMAQVVQILKKVPLQDSSKILISGVDTREINTVSLGFKYLTEFKKTISSPMIGIEYAETNIDRAFAKINQPQVSYFLTVPIDKLEKLNNPWNRVSYQLAMKMQASGWTKFAEGANFLILKRS